MQVPTMTTEGNHEVCPAFERDTCSCVPFQRGHVHLGCQMGLPAPSMCFSAKHSAHLLGALRGSPCAHLLAKAGTMLDHCAGTLPEHCAGTLLEHCAGNMLAQHLQSRCLHAYICHTSGECLQTDWPGLRPAGASDRFKNTATDSGEWNRACALSSHQQGHLSIGKPADAASLPVCTNELC